MIIFFSKQPNHNRIMVSFVCDYCQATVKKPKLKYHSCKSSFTCIDCSMTFYADNSHSQCITEVQKYQKHLNISKPVGTSIIQQIKKDSSNKESKDTNTSNKKVKESKDTKDTGKEKAKEINQCNEDEKIEMKSTNDIQKICLAILQKKSLSHSKLVAKVSKKCEKKQIEKALVDEFFQGVLYQVKNDEIVMKMK